MSVEGEQSEIHRSEGNGSEKSNELDKKCDRKCFHQGDRRCYNDEEVKEVVKKIPDDSIRTSSNESVELDAEIDSLHSGESLFKTFSFETQENDPDLDKCMTFWKNILAKNVKPIKCTLLTSKKNKEKVIKKEKVKEKPSCDQEQTKNMWMDIYKDLQRRQLDKITLVKGKICDPCSEFADPEYEKKQDAEDIKKLNNWKSQKQPHSSRLDVKAQVKRTLQVLQAARGSQTDTEKSSSRASSPHGKKNNSPITSKVEIPNKGKPTIQPPELQTHDDEEKAETTKEINEICCICGCEIGECICDEMEEYIGPDDHEQTGPCSPCECTLECVCESHQQYKEDICVCGCRLEECICDTLERCACTCGVRECCCQKLEEDQKPCVCGCGLDECICQQLFMKSCKCGNADCDCDMIEILNAYLETLNTPTAQGSSEDDMKLVSTECQTEDEHKWLLETTQKEGSYCVICGHFNCYCKLEKKAK